MDKIAVTCIHGYIYIYIIYRFIYYSEAKYQPLLNDQKFNNNLYTSVEGFLPNFLNVYISTAH